MFFQPLADVIKGMQVTLTIKEKNGKLTISVMPDGIDRVQPLTITGTPPELDAEFIAAITKPVTQAGIVINTQAMEKSLEEAAKKTEKKAPAKLAPAKAAKPVKEKAEDEDKDDDEEADGDDQEPQPAKKPQKKAALPAKPTAKKPAPQQPAKPALKQMEIL